MLKHLALQNAVLLAVGPMIIGQTCDADYSATQAHKGLGEVARQVVLIRAYRVAVSPEPESSDITYQGCTAEPFQERYGQNPTRVMLLWEFQFSVVQCRGVLRGSCGVNAGRGSPLESVRVRAVDRIQHGLHHIIWTLFHANLLIYNTIFLIQLRLVRNRPCEGDGRSAYAARARAEHVLRTRRGSSMY